MQTAVDYNGSNSNNVTNITTTSTTISSSNNIAVNERGNNEPLAAPPMPFATNTVTLTSPAATAIEATIATTMTPITISPTTTTTPAPLLLEHQLLLQPQAAPQNVLRNRLQMGKSTNNHHQNGNNASSTTKTHAKNGISQHQQQQQQRFDATAEYLGSNVEQMSVTPSPSPQVSPSKKAVTVVVSKNNNNATKNGSINKLSPTSSSSSSSTSSAAASASNSTSGSNTNSTTSSVIATPILARNGNALHAEVVGAAAVGGDINSKTASTIFAEQLSQTSALVTGNSNASSSSSQPSSIAATPTSSITATVAAIRTSSRGQQDEEEEDLLQWKDMPQYLQFNPYVLKGYRPIQTFKGCLFSLFYWHNETINILTHAIPIVYILAIVPGLMPWDRGYRFLSFCHVFGSVAPWCGSFVYHLFMNIERGENVYYRLLKLDMVGIWVSQSFGALPLVTATTFCFSYKWKWFIIIAYCMMSLWGLYKAMTASSPWQRRLCFALPFTMRSILTFLRTLDLVGGNRVALPHVYLQDVVSILGGAIGAMRIPEKWFPGLVDYYLNSHNIMHVLVVVAVYSMHKATIKDFEWMSGTTCAAFSNGTNITLETTLGANMEL